MKDCLFKIAGANMYTNILVPVDGSDASTCGLNEAIKLAKQQGSKLRLLHVVMEPVLDYGYESGQSKADVIASLCQNGKNILNRAEIVARQQGFAPECVMFESVNGPAAGVILDQAKQWPASLIVMGTHARHGSRRIGGDTAQVLAGTPVPVIFVRGMVPSSPAAEHRLLNYASVA
jgi:nucleotide-binding universal stress UspA family protein